MPDQITSGSPLPQGTVPEISPPASPVPGTYGGYGSYGGYGDFGDGGGSGGGDGTFHLMDYVRIIYRHRWLAGTAFLLIFVAAAISTFSETPVYEGRVQLLLSPETSGVVPFASSADAGYAYGYEEYYLQTQYAILKSRGLARRTIDALELWDPPAPAERDAGKKPSFSVRAAIGSGVRWVKSLFQEPTPAPAGPPDAGETKRQSARIDAFLGSLAVAPVRNSRLVDVRFVSPNPELAASAANALAKEFIAQNLEYKLEATRDAAAWLSEQMNQERKKLEESEQALQSYREKGDAVALEDRQNIVVQRLTDLNAAYTKARTDRFEKEALYDQLKDLQADRTALDTFPAILSNSFIQQLKSQLADLQRQQAQMAERLGEKHPEMVKLKKAIENTDAKLSAEIGKVVQSVRNEFLSAQAQEQSLAAALDTQKTDALSLNRRGIEYGVLRREAESNKQMYELLMQRAKETDISGEIKTSNIRIVDPAEVPRRPIRPNTQANLLAGFMAGLIAAVGLALFVDYLDNRVKNPDEIKQRLGLPYLGLVPRWSGTEAGGIAHQTGGGSVPQNFVEAFRVIRTNVLFSSTQGGSRSILVTSAQPGEGKTVVASNLAESFARTGARVLLIDADMRKPRQHDVFEISREPGLSNLLVGNASANDSVRKTQVTNLWVLPAGPNPPNPAELLGSTRFNKLMQTLAGHFDWVILDSPPVMAVTDPSVMANVTTGVLLVIGCGQTARRNVQAAAEQLLASRGTILGAVLNRVDIRSHPYYYAHYYRHDYAGYYAAEKNA